jgi:hypothetical protein
MTNNQWEFSSKTSETQKPREVKKLWLGKLVEAAVTFPQHMLYINVLVALAVLEDRPISWDGFLQSTLSDEQIRLLGDKKDKAHAGQNLGGAPIEKVQQPEIFKQLWRETKDSVTTCLAFILLDDMSAGSVISPEQKGELIRALVNPANKDNLAKITAILKTASSAFQSNTSKDWIKDYRLRMRERLAGGDHNFSADEKETVDYFIRDVLTPSLEELNLLNDDIFTEKILRAFSLISPDYKPVSDF